MNTELLKKLDALRLSFEALDVVLPLSQAENDVGCIIDAEGNDVLVVDVNNERPDDQVKAIVSLVVNLVNCNAGFLPGATYTADEMEVA
jgi:hypothetical protein